MGKFMLLLVVLLLLLVVSSFHLEAQAVTVQAREDVTGMWGLRCLAGCDYWQTLGSETELNALFWSDWEAANWGLFLLARGRGSEYVPLPPPQYPV